MENGSEASINREDGASSTKVVELQKKILEANGRPIRLGKTVKDRPLFLSVDNQRFTSHPEEAKFLEMPHYDPSLVPNQPVDGIAFINILTGDDENNLKPVGRYYWFLRGDTACGGSGPFQQQYLSELGVKQSDEFKKGLEWWDNSMTTTKVDEDFREQGIGGFMLAASLANLDQLGFKKFDPWNLTPDARKLWSRFWEWDKVKMESTFSVRPDSSNISVQDLLAKPVVEQAVAHFL